MLPFECDARQHPVPDVRARWIVEHLDVVEHVLSGFIACPVGSAPDPFTLQQIEEALGEGVDAPIFVKLCRSRRAAHKDTGKFLGRCNVSGIV